MKAHHFNSSDAISIICSLAFFKLMCETIHFHEEAEILVPAFFVRNGFSKTFNSSMSAAKHIAPVIASVNTAKPTTQKIVLPNYPEVVRY